MTIIVYDGSELAIDNAAIHDGTKVPILKAWAAPSGEVITGIGNAAQLAVMRDWYLAGAKREDFPQTQRESSPWCELIVVSKDGLKRYENLHLPVQHGHHKCAFGIGKDFAYGALGMGATAAQAAEVALRYAPDTGHGIGTYNWRTENGKSS
jgi:hypothetical protein